VQPEGAEVAVPQGEITGWSKVNGERPKALASDVRSCSATGIALVPAAETDSVSAGQAILNSE
jgi:hypothetical protein